MEAKMEPPTRKQVADELLDAWQHQLRALLKPAPAEAEPEVESVAECGNRGAHGQDCVWADPAPESAMAEQMELLWRFVAEVAKPNGMPWYQAAQEALDARKGAP